MSQSPFLFMKENSPIVLWNDSADPKELKDALTWGIVGATCNPERLKGSYQPKYTQRRSDIYLDLGQPLHNCPCTEMARYMSSQGICRLPYSESKTEG